MGLRMTNLVNLAKKDVGGHGGFFEAAGFYTRGDGQQEGGGRDLKRKRLLDDDGWEVWPEEEFENAQKEEQDQERRLTQELHDTIEASKKSAKSPTKSTTFPIANSNITTHTNPWDRARSESRSPTKQQQPQLPISAINGRRTPLQQQQQPDTYLCPICSKPQPADDIKFNRHIDWCLSLPVIKEATKQPRPPQPAPAAANQGPRSRAGSKAPEAQEKQGGKGKEKTEKRRRVEGFFEPRGR
jgi:DNA polymerase kappa